MSLMSVSIPVRRTRWWRVIPLLLVWLGAPSSVSGQSRLVLPDFNDLLRPDFTSEDAPLILEQLLVGPDQRVVIETLLSDYENGFMMGTVQLRDRLSALHPLPQDVGATDRRKRDEFRRRLQEKIDQFQEAQKAGGGPEELQKLRKDLEALQKQSNEELTALRPDPLTPEETRKIGEAMIAELKDWRTRRTEYRTTLDNGLQAVLTPRQQVQWTRIDRSLRLKRERSDARLSGESIDLRSVVERQNLEPDQSSALAPMLDDYETELDALLVRMRTFLIDADFELYGALASGDTARSMTLFDQELDWRQQVCSINDRFTEAMAKALPAGPADAFRAAVRESGFPRIFRPSQVSRIFAASKSLGNMPDDMAGELAQLRAEYFRTYDGYTGDLYRTTLDSEPGQAKIRMAHRYGLTTQVNKEVDASLERIQELYQQRSSLDRIYRKRLLDLIGPDRFAALEQ